MTPDQQLAALRAAQAWFDAEVAPCPRSAEWQHGARAGCWLAHGLAPQPSAWANGTAQDDARNAGFGYALRAARRHLQGGAA